MPATIDRLDFNVAYACNLGCKGCISLSDFDRRGVEPIESIQQQCELWSKVLTPRVITIFGGEPLIHPHIHQAISLVRQYWPGATIRLITNGYLLKNHDPSSWFEYSPFELQVSIHRQDHKSVLVKEIKRIVQCRTGWKVKQHKDNGHKDIEFSIPGFTIYQSRFGEFVKPYRDNLTPFASNPVKAHSMCGSPSTPVLYKNKLYKCPPVANLLDINPTHTNYSGFEHNDDLSSLVDNIGKPESVCAMCPDDTKHSVDHYLEENVHVKNSDQWVWTDF